MKPDTPITPELVGVRAYNVAKAAAEYIANRDPSSGPLTVSEFVMHVSYEQFKDFRAVGKISLHIISKLVADCGFEDWGKTQSLPEIRYVTIREYANMCGISRFSVRDRIKHGSLILKTLPGVTPHVKFVDLWKYPPVKKR